MLCNNLPLHKTSIDSAGKIQVSIGRDPNRLKTGTVVKFGSVAGVVVSLAGLYSLFRNIFIKLDTWGDPKAKRAAQEYYVKLSTVGRFVTFMKLFGPQPTLETTEKEEALNGERGISKWASAFLEEHDCEQKIRTRVPTGARVERRSEKTTQRKKR